MPVWLSWVINLGIIYWSAMMFSVVLSTVIYHSGNGVKKGIMLLISVTAIVMMYLWGSTISESNTYLFIVIGIVIWNIITQFRYIRRKQRHYDKMVKEYGLDE